MTLNLWRALHKAGQTVGRSGLSLQLAEKVIEASLESIIITDARGRIEFVNPAFTETTGYRPDEVIGKSPSVLASGRHDADFYRAMWNSLLTKGHWRGEIWNRRKNGELYLERLTITAIRDAGGETTHYAALFFDITQIRENEERIRRLAYYDSLTGLPNRRLLEDRLTLAIHHAHRQRSQLAVLFLDLDRFKEVNDTLGHAVGDELLLALSRRLSHQLREDDTLARLGGDEFIVLLPGVGGTDGIDRVARRLIEAVCEPFRLGERTYRLGCSLGIGLYPGDATTAEALLCHADAAMYRAKREGRNTHRYFQAERDLQDHGRPTPGESAPST